MKKKQFKEIEESSGYSHSNTNGEMDKESSQDVGRQTWSGNGSPYPKVVKTGEPTAGKPEGGGVRHSGEEYKQGSGESSQVTVVRKTKSIKLDSSLLINRLKAL